MALEVLNLIPAASNSAANCLSGCWESSNPPILLKHLPQDATRNMVKCLLQDHKAHVDWLAKLLWTPPALCRLEDLEGVQCSRTRNKTALLLLKPFYIKSIEVNTIIIIIVHIVKILNLKGVQESLFLLWIIQTADQIPFSTSFPHLSVKWNFWTSFEIVHF